MKPRLRDFRSIKFIGEGAYGQMWLAQEIATSHYVAVKIVSRERNGPEAFACELKGVRAFKAISLKHDGFAKILHVVLNKKATEFHYSMELADDLNGKPIEDPRTYEPKTLRTELNKHQRLSAKTCCRIGLELLAALNYLHRQNKIHRDIKPSNIIFVDGHPKLADIGLVTAMTNGEARTIGRGTPGYMSPVAEKRGATPKNDLFALGRLLYEIHTGLNPEKDFPTLSRDVLKSNGFSSELNRIVCKACDNDPTQCYASANEMKKALLGLRKELSRHKTGSNTQGRRRTIKDYKAANTGPGDSRARINNILSKGFTGRSEERAKTHEFCQQNKCQRFFISGSPGMGKSALMAQTVKEITEGTTLEGVPIERCPKVISYFIERHNTPDEYCRYLISQLDVMFSAGSRVHHAEFSGATHQDAVAQRFDFIDRNHLISPAKPHERLFLFLDGIDQSIDIVRCVPKCFPWLAVIMSGRTLPEAVMGYEGDYDQLEIHNLDDSNAKVLFNSLLKDKTIEGLTDVWKQSAIQIAGGLPIYLVSLANWIIRKGKCPNIKDIPPSLEKLYGELVNSISQKGNNKTVLDVIYLLSVMNAPVTCKILSECFIDKNNVEIRNAVIDCALVLNEDEHKRFQLFHASFAQFVFKEYNVIKWLTEQAENGHAYAQYYLGCLYEQGRDVDIDELSYWREKAGKGDFFAQSVLEELYACYASCRDVDKNEALAVQWYTKAAEQGHADAQYKLGSMYLLGRGVKKDLTKAFQWLTKSVGSDSTKQWKLGNFYMWETHGGSLNVDKYRALAIHWYTKAGEQGLQYAQVALGDVYAKGLGVDKDDNEAKKWWLKAAKQGNEQAIAKLKELEKECEDTVSRDCCKG